MPRKSKESTVAIAERELQTGTDTENEQTENANDDNETDEQNETTTKRKRVDLTKVDPNEKVVLSFFVPAGLRLELRKLAEKNDDSEANYVRNMIASQVGYAIPESFNERKHRTGQYSGMNEAEKKAAIARESKEKRETVANLLKAIASGAIDPAKLAAIGVNVENLPKPRGANKD